MPRARRDRLRLGRAGRVVHLGHVRETRAHGGIVRADQRILAEQVDVVFDQGDRARLDLDRSERRRWSGSGLAAERLQRARQRADGASRHALVEVYAALQAGDLDPARRPAEPSGMAFDARRGKPGSSASRSPWRPRSGPRSSRGRSRGSGRPVVRIGRAGADHVGRGLGGLASPAACLVAVRPAPAWPRSASFPNSLGPRSASVGAPSFASPVVHPLSASGLVLDCHPRT